MTFCWPYCVVCSCTYSVNDRPSLNFTLSGWTDYPPVTSPDRNPVHASVGFRSTVAEDTLLLGCDTVIVYGRFEATQCRNHQG